MHDSDQPQNPVKPEEIGQFSTRLKELVGQHSIRAFAQRVGLAQNTIHNMLNGSHPRLDNLITIANACNVAVEWLATGRGPKSYSPPHRLQEAAGHYSDAPTPLNEFCFIPFFDNPIPNQPWNSAALERYKLPFRCDWLYAEGLAPEHLVSIKAQGDTMEPLIRSGDILLIDTRHTQPAEGLYVLKINHHLAIKRLQRLDENRIRIKNDNPAYDSVDMDIAQLNDNTSDHYTIIGKVVWSGRRF